MDSRTLIVQADQIARAQGISQAEWCRMAGFDEFGKVVSRTFSKGNCKVSVLIQLLKPLGYELHITRREEPDEKQSV